MPTDEHIAFATRLANAAGDIIRPFFSNAGEIQTKPDKSPVTLADRTAEKIIRGLIEQHYPDHGIYGEELGQTGLDKKYVWAIDPIDGTRAFIEGRKEWGTLIALCEDGIPILGILDQPVTGERWLGVKGRPTTLNGKPVKTRACAKLGDAAISTTSKNYFTPPQAAKFVKLAQQCANAFDGGDCYAYGMLARGERDIVIDAALKPYDILALVPIVEGAGGKISGWDGKPVTLTCFANAAAANSSSLHFAAQVLLDLH